MTSKNKTISFRITEEQFEELQRVAEDSEESLSAIFRDYVDDLIEHDGQTTVVPEGKNIRSDSVETQEFPPKVEVSKTFVREHERRKLECEHLREQLAEYKKHVSRLEREKERAETQTEDVTRLEDLDYEVGTAIRIDETADIVM